MIYSQLITRQMDGFPSTQSNY